MAYQWGIRKHPQAELSVALGVAGTLPSVFCAGLTGLLGIPATILGLKALLEINMSPPRYRGLGAAIAGIVTGIISFIWGFFCFIGTIAIFAERKAKEGYWISSDDILFLVVFGALYIVVGLLAVWIWCYIMFGPAGTP
jgi:hypothetical protein